MMSQVRILVTLGGIIIIFMYFLPVKKCTELMICILYLHNTWTKCLFKNKKLINFTCTSFKESNSSKRFKNSISLLPTPSPCNVHFPTDNLFQLFLIDSFAFDLMDLNNKLCCFGFKRYLLTSQCGRWGYSSFSHHFLCVGESFPYLHPSNVGDL